jgi:DNA-binding Xre family transcriptional regulator
MEINGNKFVEKNEYYMVCNNCDYKCSYLSDWNRHINTRRHFDNHKGNNLEINGNKFAEKNEKTDFYQCEECKKEYKTLSGLWKHKKKCLEKSEVNNICESLNITPELVIEIIKQNQELQKQNNELQKQMLEVIKNGSNNTNINNSNNNSNNKTFNLQFFLNEECKDALNISEFVSSIKVDLEDLETTGRLGYVEGVSRIINKNLNDLDQTKRPIHCSDVKREVLYIKSDDQWIKENETNKPVFTKAIKQIANENIKQISEWRKKYPDCTDSDSRKNDLYLNIVSNAMSGTTSEEQITNYEKIITKVAKEVVIEK